LSNGNHQQLHSSTDAKGDLFRQSSKLPAKALFFWQAQGQFTPCLKATGLIKAYLRILWGEISSACCTSKWKKANALE